MFVDAGLLYPRGSRSHRAGGHARDAAGYLSREPTDTEEHNAAELRMVGCSSAT
jgi:hypothetical protein